MPTSVLYGVPQSSVIGPILFLLYTADVLQLVKSHQLRLQAYADDTQICGSSRSSHVNNTQHPTGSCLRLHRRGVNVDYGQSTAVQPPSRPRYSGVRQLAVNIRSQLDKYVLATRLFCRSLPSATSGSTSTLTSPCLLTSQRPSEPSYKHTASQLHDDCQYMTEWRMFNTLVSLHHTSTGVC